MFQLDLPQSKTYKSKIVILIKIIVTKKFNKINLNVFTANRNLNFRSIIKNKSKTKLMLFVLKVYERSHET